MTLLDQAARDRIRNALDRTLVVEAAAGTGKTTELVNRIVRILASGMTTVGRIVAVTFTDKAAGELKLRLRSELERVRESDETNGRERERLEQALAHLEEARAGTIHSFCGELLRERPVEAAIDPKFEQLNEVAAEKLYRAAFRVWMERTLANPPEGVRRSLRRSVDEESAMERLVRAGWTLVNWRDHQGSWTRPRFERTHEIDQLIEDLGGFAKLSADPDRADHPVYVRTQVARDLSEYVRTVEKTRQRDYDGLESLLIELGRKLDSKYKKPGRASYGRNVSRDEVVNSESQLLLSLLAFKSRADADLAALLALELRGSIDEYERLKEIGGKLDFLDLLIKTRDLLRSSEAVRNDIQNRFTHIFVDEFQDTDPLQAEVILLIASNDPSVSDWRQVEVVPGKLFIVGDPKQAIYRFRRADVGLYFDIKGRLERCGATTERLTTSFRSLPSIQNFINGAFASKMNGDRTMLQADYVPLTPSRPQIEQQPSVIALSIPRPYGERNVTRTAVDESLPDAVGAFVDWLIHKSGWTVAESGDGENRVAIKPQHVCLMFRRLEKYQTGDMTRRYVDAFQARGIPHVLVGGKSFHTREEVGTIRSALSAIEWPNDALSIYATLRGSLFGISDSDLFAYRAEFGQWHPFRVPEIAPKEFSSITSALETLRQLSRQRNQRPIATTIHELLRVTRAHAGFVMRPAGEQALANVLHVAELGRQYEAGGGISFRGFVEELLEAAEDGKQQEALIYEEGSEGVRLMTAHRAKGLEFPIVILADATCKIAHEQPSRYLDGERDLAANTLAGWAPQDVIDHAAQEHARDVAEGIRIAYVAATRARDLLVVPAIGDDPTGHGPEPSGDWWVAPLYSALYPTDDAKHSSQDHMACPKFGSDDSSASARQ